MVLVQVDIDAEFPELLFDVEESGYVDNDAAAEDTIDPDDTGSDLTDSGRLDGYEHAFFDFDALERPIILGAQVNLFSSDQEALDFLQRQVDDFRLFQGVEI